MKVNIDIDCTPEEARRFMGLPDVTELHKAWMNKMMDQIQNGGHEEMFQAWTQMGLQGFEQWQKFMGSFDSPTPSKKK